MDTELVDIKGLKILTRKNTTDAKVIQEVIKGNVYIRKGVKLDKDQVWLDLGGNIGTFSVLVSSKVKKVYTYECEKDNLIMLRENVKLNKCENVVIEPYAVSHLGTEDKIYLCNTTYNKYQHSLIQKTHKRFIEIQSKKFDDIFTDDITGIKMDIEGSEMSILENVEDWKNVKYLIFEWSFSFDRKTQRLRDVIKKLSNHFKTIKYHNSVNKVESYDFYPAGIMVYCLVD